MMRFNLTFAVAALLTISGCGHRSLPNIRAEEDQVKSIRQTLASTATGPATEGAAVGTGWATFRGVITLEGDAPAEKPLLINKDVEVCSKDGHAPLDHKLVVDSASHGIANVVIYARKVRRVNDSAAKPPADELVYDQKHCEFLTHVTSVYVGQKMKIVNSDPVGHNTNISAQAGAAFNSLIPAGGSTDFSPSGEESLPIGVTCNIHPWMKAYLLPRKNGYVAVTKPDGSFEIKDLPAGEDIEFQAWHESATGPQGALVLTVPEVKDLKWDAKGRFHLNLKADESRQLNVKVPLGAFSGS